MDSWKFAQTLFSVIGISVGQLLLKIGALQLRNHAAIGVSVGDIRINAALIGGVGVLGISTAMWVWVLRSVPLGVAYPVMACAFIIVPVLSYFLLGEHLGWRHLVGGLLIVLGVLLVASGPASGPPQTPRVASEAES